MSADIRLREAHRRWQESGLVEDEGAWHLERLRVGELTQAGLELAAYFGQPAALGVTGGTPAAEPTKSTIPWLRRVPHGRDLVILRASLAVMEYFGPRVTDRVLDLGPESPTCDELRWALEGWLLAPETTLESRIVRANWPSRTQPLCEPPTVLALEHLPMEACHFRSLADVVRVIRGELVPWALGLRDPVRERAPRPDRTLKLTLGAVTCLTGDARGLAALVPVVEATGRLALGPSGALIVQEGEGPVVVGMAGPALRLLGSWSDREPFADLLAGLVRCAGGRRERLMSSTHPFLAPGSSLDLVRLAD